MVERPFLDFKRRLAEMPDAVVETAFGEMVADFAEAAAELSETQTAALTAAHQRIEELTRALREARQYVEQIVTDQFQDIDGSIDVLPRIDAILSKQGGER